MQAGDDLVVVHRPGHGVTVSTMFRALTTERSLLPELGKVENLARGRAPASWMRSWAEPASLISSNSIDFGHESSPT